MASAMFCYFGVSVPGGGLEPFRRVILSGELPPKENPPESIAPE